MKSVRSARKIKKRESIPSVCLMMCDDNLSLRFTPYAWSKLLYLRDIGESEVGGFGISGRDDLLLIEDFLLVKQYCTSTTVRFDDEAVADFFKDQVERGLHPKEFFRIWIHTHPGNCPRPSEVDESTFERCFGMADWALMFVLARDDSTHARLRVGSDSDNERRLPVEIDCDSAVTGLNQSQWKDEYQLNVQTDTSEPEHRDGDSKSRRNKNRELDDHQTFRNETENE